MSTELEEWLREEREAGEARFVMLLERLKADGRWQDFYDAIDDKNIRKKLYKEYGINDDL